MFPTGLGPVECFSCRVPSNPSALPLEAPCIPAGRLRGAQSCFSKGCANAHPLEWRLVPEWARRVGVVLTSSKAGLPTSRKLRADPVMTRPNPRLLLRINPRFSLGECTDLKTGIYPCGTRAPTCGGRLVAPGAYPRNPSPRSGWPASDPEFFQGTGY